MAVTCRVLTKKVRFENKKKLYFSILGGWKSLFSLKTKKRLDLAQYYFESTIPNYGTLSVFDLLNMYELIRISVTSLKTSHMKSHLHD